MKFFYSLLFCILAINLNAQESTKPILFEKTVNGMLRFYFDKNYFLCDKNCEFKAIERVASFDTKNSRFNGEFRDFAPNGHVILTGNYVDGEKEGVFKAYHPNKVLKWEVVFKNNFPTGEWKYYYPDAKPMLVVNYTDSIMRIESLWDIKGREKVKDGKGDFEFTYHFEGFTEFGFPSYRRKGRVVNGVPNGFWTLTLVDGKFSELGREEYYKNGVLADFGEQYFNFELVNNKLQFFPAENFNRAEILYFKNCTFDDFSGFSIYLTEKLNSRFATLLVDAEVADDDFSYVIAVSEKGEPGRADFTKAFADEKLNRQLNIAVSRIRYYLPSFKDGEYVKDILSVSGKLIIKEDGTPAVHSISIKRNAEQ
ncbi:toxin-antitoxin system YwqK family antitoxin [Sphingobacterium hungaricum]|uniref:MORN repeat variant n=1 Tax=Sphingobacterium hungaricum TaxID=2082723 RepID=A0A928YQP9_9SPHI|nr:hypothetical protein [Sphingobacterium hungaricum]MBE8714194.1 hypothetical protein [Sphingobacterium hungaricum]